MHSTTRRTPCPRHPQRPWEEHTADIAIAEAPDADINARSETIIPVDKPLEADYAKGSGLHGRAHHDPHRAERRGERAHRGGLLGQRQRAPRCSTPTGKFMEINCLPIGQPIITKRKYVEVLARSRTDRVTSQERRRTPDVGRDGFKVQRRSQRKNMFSVLEDKNPKGREWLNRIHAER